MVEKDRDVPPEQPGNYLPCVMAYLSIPADKKTLELTNSIIWFEDDGILYSRFADKPFVQATRKQMEEDLKKWREFVGHKKVLIITESHPNSESPAKEDREYISQALTEVAAGMAILTPSAVSRMVVNLFFLFKPAAFPTKMFQSVSEARHWLLNIRKKGPGVPVI